MKRILQVMIFLMLMNGCSSYKALQHFKKSDEYTKAVKYSKKADIIVKNSVQTIFYATYLNKVFKKYDNDSYNFIIGFYSADDKFENYELTLNTKTFLNIKEIKKDNSLHKIISIKNFWAKYYLVSFKKSENLDNLKLRLFNNTYGSALISFKN